MKPIAYQLYSSRNFDLDETISMLAHLGIAEVEGYGPLYENTATTRTLLDTYNMTMPTGHFAIDLVENDPDRVLEIARELGIKNVIIPFIQPDRRPVDTPGWRKLGVKVASIGKPIRDAGLGYGWHNHDFEFSALPDGTLPIEHLAEASPEIDLELDLAWIHVAGHNPVTWIERFSGRILAAHMKDRASEGQNADEDGWADVGHGVMDWATIAAALKAANVPRFILEHDNPSDAERFARRSLATVKGL